MVQTRLNLVFYFLLIQSNYRLSAQELLDCLLMELNSETLKHNPVTETGSGDALLPWAPSQKLSGSSHTRLMARNKPKSKA